MKKNGFISTTLIFTFFVLFLLLMVLLLNNYSSNRFLLNTSKNDSKDNLSQKSSTDIELRFKICDNVNDDHTCDTSMTMPEYIAEYAGCNCSSPEGAVGNASCDFQNGEIKIVTSKQTKCTAYFKRKNSDVILEFYTKEYTNGEFVLVNKVPSDNYVYLESKCYGWDEAQNKYSEAIKSSDVIKYEGGAITVNSEEKIKCSIKFEKQIQYYLTDAKDIETAKGSTTNEYVSKQPTGNAIGEYCVKTNTNNCDSCSGVCKIYYPASSLQNNYCVYDEENNCNHDVQITDKHYVYDIADDKTIEYKEYENEYIYIFTWDKTNKLYKLAEKKEATSGNYDFPDDQELVPIDSYCSNEKGKLKFNDNSYTLSGDFTNAYCKLSFKE